MASWPASLPIWTSYSSNYRNAVRRSQVRGKKSQRRISQRKTERVSVSNRFTSDQLAEFEYFAIVILNNCTDVFVGSYWDNGVQTGDIRIIEGYSVNAVSDGNWDVFSEIEVLR
jgi:hypothetical protein